MSGRRLPAPSDVTWLERVRAEYLEMPGLSLTEPQAQRFWHLDAHTCRAVFGALVDAGFLRRTETGRYVRTGPDVAGHHADA